MNGVPGQLERLRMLLARFPHLGMGALLLIELWGLYGFYA